MKKSLLLAASLAVVLAACGKEAPKPAAAPAAPVAAPAAPAAPAEQKKDEPKK